VSSNSFNHQSDEVKACGFCDTLIIKEKELYGEVATGRAVAALLKEKGVKKLAIFGSGKLAKSIVLHLSESSVEEIVFFNDRIESCMALVKAHTNELEGIRVDIDRAVENQEIDLSSVDGCINASPSAPKLNKINKETVLIDLKNDSNVSDYAAAYGANFINNEN